MSERFKVDLRGIIDLAANHLYTSPDVFVREVIQNSVDAITARGQVEPGFTGQVRIELVPGDGSTPARIGVIDNGVGLTTSEVHEFLSTVGGSSKREQAEERAGELTDENAGFLGRFGIGLLSCFMVSDEIVVVTRSARDQTAPGVEWRGRADGSYSVRELPDSPLPLGTSVYLTCKDGVEEYFELERLEELARRYAEMLTTEIMVVCDGQETRINADRPAWKIASNEEQALADICERTLGFRPLDAFRVSIDGGLIEGYAFVRSARSDAWGGEHRLYARGMYVGERVYGLVPRWATFIAFVLNTNGLKLTASREGLQQDDRLSACEEQMAKAIRGRLVHLLRNDPDRFETVMGVHNTEVRGLAVKDDEFFALVIDLLEFETSLGPIRFGEFRREHTQLLVARTGEQFRRVAAVAAAQGLRVFNGGYTYHEELLARAAGRYAGLELRAFDSADIVALWDRVPESEPWRVLLERGADIVAARGCELAVRAFAPSEVPAYFALGIDAEFHRQLDRTKSQASGLWQEVLDAMAPRPEEMAPTQLCLNATSPVVQKLVALNDEALQRAVLEVLYAQALMNGQYALTGEELAALQRGLARLLEGLASTRGFG